MNNINETPDKISDKELYKKCVIYGRQALRARRKFIGLLPEVYKRQLYQKKGCGSIHEFAAKMAGISHEQVNRVLSLEKRFIATPILHAALAEGNISVNKLLRLAPIATAENQAKLAKKAEVLSNRALEVFVQDYKREKTGDYANGSGFVKKQTKGKSVHHRQGGVSDVHVHGHGHETIPTMNLASNVGAAPMLNLAPDVEAELTQLQQKGLDINEILRQFLHDRQAKIEQTKRELAIKQAREYEEKSMIGMPAKRYIPAEIRKIITAQHGTQCTAYGCAKKAENLHHEKPFATFRSHDPRHLKPLCRAHHEIVHSEDAKVLLHKRFMTNAHLPYSGQRR